MKLAFVSEEFSNKVAFTLLFALVFCWASELLFSWSWTSGALLGAAILSAAWLLLDVLISKRPGSGKRISALLGILLISQIADRLGSLPDWFSTVLFGTFVVLVVWHLASELGSRGGEGSA